MNYITVLSAMTRSSRQVSSAPKSSGCFQKVRGYISHRFEYEFSFIDCMQLKTKLSVSRISLINSMYPLNSVEIVSMYIRDWWMLSKGDEQLDAKDLLKAS